MSEDNHPPDGLCPYDRLHIYYLSGCARTADQAMGPDFIGNWVEDGFSFLFFSQSADDRVAQVTAGQPELVLLDRYTMGYEEWLGEIPTPFDIGSFTVSPPWVSVNRLLLPGFGARHIVLDPGVVFGTGTHPTTRDCLELMEAVLPPRGVERVLDLGCGTGLLSLAAARLRCRNILAVDFNALAVETTWRNVLLNGLDHRILPVRGLAEEMVNMKADLLIANIHFDVMVKILNEPGFLEKPYFILSGLLRTQARAVEAMLADLPVTLLEIRSQTGVWHSFLGKSRGAIDFI
ncbi:hypothetical protein JCM14469_17450 [Desulfatiferula olefinivorans]